VLKNIHFSIFCVLLILSVFSCSNKGKTPNTDKNISFQHYFSGTLSGGIDDMLKIFNKNHSHYNLKATPLDHESFKTSIRRTLNEGTPPDIYSYWAGSRVESIIDKLEPIDDIWAKHKIDQFFSKNLIENACTYKGKKYFIPITQHYAVIFYNKKIFNKLGLSEPKDWNSFKNLCGKIKSSNITPIVLGAKTKWPAQFWFDYILLRTQSIEFRNKLLKSEISWNNPKVVNALNLWEELLSKGYFNKNINETDWDNDAINQFVKGEASMMLMGTFVLGIFQSKKYSLKQGIDYDFFKFPIIDPNIPTVSLGGIDGLIIPKNAYNKSGAKDAIAFFVNNYAQKEMSKGSGCIAPNILVEETFYTDMQKKMLKNIKKDLLWAFPYDLSTPPEIASLGLTFFSEFLEFSENKNFLLSELDTNIAKLKGNK